MTQVTLNAIEQALVKHLAKKRIEHDRSVGAMATIYHGAQALENEVDSLGAEFAYCKVMNVYPDTDPGHFSPFDARLRDGRAVDVKSTRRHNGRLLVKAKDRADVPDLYALMVGTFPSYRLAGHITAAELLREERVDRSLPHPAYAATQMQLFDVAMEAIAC